MCLSPTQVGRNFKILMIMMKKVVIVNKTYFFIGKETAMSSSLKTFDPLNIVDSRALSHGGSFKNLRKGVQDKGSKKCLVHSI